MSSEWGVPQTFVLDTDYILRALVVDAARSAAYQMAVKHLVNLGCRVVVPNEVLDEVLKHINASRKSFRYYEAAFDTIDRGVLLGEVANVFLEGY